MSDFAANVDTWHDFFMLSGTAAATLMGLLFVALSLRLDIRTQSDNSLMRATAGHSFMSYLCVLLFALYFLIPDQDPVSLATSVLLTSLFPLVTMVRATIQFRTAPEMTTEILWWRFFMPIACYLAGVLVAMGLFVDKESGMGWFVAVIALLLTVPTRNAWAMLTDSQEPAA